jgi:hypothetical protein
MNGGELGPPSGVITFLFTDIEGSTRRWEADADVMRSALAVHDDVLRKAVEAHAGWFDKVYESLARSGGNMTNATVTRYALDQIDRAQAELLPGRKDA